MELEKNDILQKAATEIGRLSQHLSIINKIKQNADNKNRRFSDFDISTTSNFDIWCFPLGLLEHTEIARSSVIALGDEIKRLQNVIVSATNEILLDNMCMYQLPKKKVIMLVFGFIGTATLFVPNEVANLCVEYFYCPPISLKQFQLKNTFEAGFALSRIRLALHQPSRKYFALKILRKTRVVAMKQQNHIKWEQKILQNISHPFIANLFASFQDQYFLYMAMELIRERLRTFLCRINYTLKRGDCAFYASQIVLVLEYLHSKHIVHRHLKLENLLIDTNGYLRVTGFGFAKKLKSSLEKTWTLCGTPEYIAPEILLNRGHSFPVDLWSLGILLFEILTGTPPFYDDNPMKTYQKILDGVIDWNHDNMGHIAKDLILKLLNSDLKQRYNVSQVKKHLFFESIDFAKMFDREYAKVPWKPPRTVTVDLPHFDDYEEVSDTEDIALDDDRFLGGFEYVNMNIAYF